MPIVSKKSESITAKIGTRAVRNPSVPKNPSETLPTSPKSGTETTSAGTCATPGPTDSHNAPSPQISLMTIATVVEIRIDSSSPPRTLRVTRTAESPSPSANTIMRMFVKSVVSPTNVTSLSTTTPAFSSPMIMRKSPMPIPIASFRLLGMAFRTASRNPVRTRTVMIAPSTRITPIASGQVRPLPATRVNATKPLSPRPDAIAKG